MAGITLGYIPEPLSVPVINILPSRRAAASVIESRKFKQIRTSISDNGLIEPLAGTAADPTSGQHVLLDGQPETDRTAGPWAHHRELPRLTDDESYNIKGITGCVVHPRRARHRRSPRPPAPAPRTRADRPAPTNRPSRAATALHSCPSRPGEKKKVYSTRTPRLTRPLRPPHPAEGKPKTPGTPKAEEREATPGQTHARKTRTRLGLGTPPGTPAKERKNIHKTPRSTYHPKITHTLPKIPRAITERNNKEP